MTESLMVLPYVSSLTLPKYFQYLVEGYYYQADHLDYFPNEEQEPQWKNLQDWKTISSFKTWRPTKLIISHATDLYLMPHDLGQMILELERDETAFAIGLYPITSYTHSRLNDEPIFPARISVWKSSLFAKAIKELGFEKKQEFPVYDGLYKIAEYLHSLEFKCLISRTARPQRLHPEEFKTMVLK